MKKRAGDDSRCLESEILMQKPPLGTPLDWENPHNDDLVLHLAMNEGHGDKVQDLSLNDNHGTLENFAFPPTVGSGWNPGESGVGLNFDGANDYVDCGNDPTLAITNDITISMFSKSSSVGAQMGVSKDDMFMLDMDAGKTRFLWANGTVFTADDILTSTVDVNDGIWHNITGVGDTAANTFYIYIDGELNNSKAKSTVPNNTNYSVYIGQLQNYNLPFAGTIDQPRIMNRAFTAKEVKDYAMNPWQVYLQ